MLGQRIRKLILFRLLFGTGLLYGPLLWVGEGYGIHFYGASTLISALSVFYLLWYLTRRRYQWLVFTQIFGDLLLETYLVSVTGGAESLFAIFFPLSILSAALVIGGGSPIVITTILACGGYLFGSFRASHLELPSIFTHDPIYFFYGTGVRIAIFLIVGYLSRYLSGTVLELQNRLKLSERLSSLGEVVSKIAHEIRNPLSAVRTAAEVLEDSLRGKMSSQEEKMLKVIDHESDRLTKTLQRILNYVRHVEPNSRMLLFDKIVEEALELVRLDTGLHSNGIVVEKKYDPYGTHVYADEEQLLSAFLNLTLNAVQAMPKGGVLTISAEEGLKGTKIDLEDEGGGIPREKLKDLFLPFKSTKKGGTGLGLAEVHKIITLHEGKSMWKVKREKGQPFISFSRNHNLRPLTPPSPPQGERVMGEGETGFTLVELIIVITIVVIMASLALTITLRARIQSNETAAIGNLRTVSNSAESYRNTQTPPAYPTSFNDMMTTSPPYLDSAWSNTQRQGYIYSFQAAANGDTFSTTAAPRVQNVSGINSYCVDHIGVIRRYGGGGSLGDANGCDASGTPI